MKLALIVLLVLQAVALAGPVCGSHLTTAESMDCCEKNHDQNDCGMKDDHATTCCSTCSTGKTQILKRQEPILPAIHASVSEIISLEQPLILETQPRDFHQSVSPSPPDIFHLRSLRI